MISWLPINTKNLFCNLI